MRARPRSRPRCGAKGRRLLALSVGVVLLLPATAAHADFTGPIDVSATPGSSPTVALAPNGDAVAVWEYFDGTNVRIRARVLPATGPLGPIRNMSGPGVDTLDPRVAIDDDGDATLVWAQRDGFGYRMRARTLSADGTAGPLHSLTPAIQSGHPADVAVDDVGNATVVWHVISGGDTWVRARTLSAAGVLGPVRTVSLAGAGQQRVAVDADGDALIVWTGISGEYFRIQARVMSDAGVLGARRVLSRAGVDSFNPEVAVTGSGDAVVTWVRFGNGQPVEARTWSSAGTLGAIHTVSGDGLYAMRPDVAVDGDGEATIVWATEDANRQVQVRTLFAGGLGPLRTLSDISQQWPAPQVVVDSVGNATVAWTRTQGSQSRVEARTVSVAGQIGPLQQLGAGGYTLGLAGAPDGDGIVVWSDAALGRVLASRGP